MHITPPFTARVINAVSIWWFRLTGRFFRLNLPQPDLTDEPLELVAAVLRGINTLGDEEVEKTEMVLFTNYPGDLAFKQGWGKNRILRKLGERGVGCSGVAGGQRRVL